MAEEGIDIGITPDTLPGQKIDITEDLKVAMENPSDDLCCADSIEELAGMIGIEPGVLKATLDEYNNCCARGYDDIFNKNRRYLRPLSGPGYYAAKANTVCLGTMGGIKVSHKMEAVDKKDKVIPGLYAVGYDAGGMYGQDYGMHITSGLSSSFAMNSGRIAGKSAAEYIDQ